MGERDPTEVDWRGADCKVADDISRRAVELEEWGGVPGKGPAGDAVSALFVC